MSYNILVVDDEKELADVIGLYLTADGCTVHKRYTGKEALECIAHINTVIYVFKKKRGEKE